MNCKRITLILLLPAMLLTAGNLQAQVKKVKHVVLLGLDGLGSYAFPKAEMPNLKKIMESGSYSLKARTVLPSSSAVNWASMLMASGPTAHGYTEWGSKTPEIPSAKIGNYGIYPSIFGLIREQMPKAKTAAVFSWGGIEYLLEKGAIDIVTHVDGDDLCTDKAVEIIVEEKPNFMFIHLNEPDGVGHGIGHDTPEYYAELKNVDKRIGLIYQAIEEAGIADETIFMLSSDHGGVGKGHGEKSLEEIYIPWIIEGRGIKKNHEISDLIMTYDTAATIAWIFGLEMPQVWRGKPVLESIN
ncbi:alkaline phosphatase [Cyclobacterium sp. 1_MG-2023]|uniref:alkaline phosphatase n=1 Tax=Cyclobacterium sp. 1_MG-2023 TaxID=3062681 RepID=UPI0026E30B8E|nr:alkaline phosphatase [Cyclobacterium sp. 1_MG-2023]MDO6436088.1 alkaline phosphatase [Cyclobacterium sp. 1_MG-2023]